MPEKTVRIVGQEADLKAACAALNKEADHLGRLAEEQSAKVESADEALWITVAMQQAKRLRDIAVQLEGAAITSHDTVLRAPAPGERFAQLEFLTDEGERVKVESDGDGNVTVQPGDPGYDFMKRWLEEQKSQPLATATAEEVAERVAQPVEEPQVPGFVPGTKMHQTPKGEWVLNPDTIDAALASADPWTPTAEDSHSGPVIPLPPEVAELLPEPSDSASDAIVFNISDHQNPR